jgi:hypothetical protein
MEPSGTLKVAVASTFFDQCIATNKKNVAIIRIFNTSESGSTSSFVRLAESYAHWESVKDGVKETSRRCGVVKTEKVHYIKLLVMRVSTINILNVLSVRSILFHQPSRATSMC